MPENRVPLDARGQSTINKWNTGPSTNGRSSAFGALCLGSNPSGPAKNAVVGRASLARAAGANDERPATNDKLEPTAESRQQLWLLLPQQPRRRSAPKTSASASRNARVSTISSRSSAVRPINRWLTKYASSWG